MGKGKPKWTRNKSSVLFLEKRIASETNHLEFCTKRLNRFKNFTGWGVDVDDLQKQVDESQARLDQLENQLRKVKNGTE